MANEFLNTPETEEGYRTMVATMAAYRQGSLVYSKWAPSKSVIRRRAMPVPLEYRMGAILSASRTLPPKDARRARARLKSLRSSYFAGQRRGEPSAASVAYYNKPLVELEDKVRPLAPEPPPLTADATTLATINEDRVCVFSKGPRQVAVRHRSSDYWDIVDLRCLATPSPHPVLGVSCCGKHVFHGPLPNGGNFKEKSAARHVLQKIAPYLALDNLELEFFAGELDHASEPWRRAYSDRPPSTIETMVNTIPTGTGWM